MALAAPAMAADAVPAAAAAVAATPAAAPAGPATRRCTAIIPDDQPTQAVLGKSVVIPLKTRVVRIVVSGQPPSRAPVPAAAMAAVPAGMQPVAAPPANANGGDGIADVDVTLLSPTD